MHTRVLKEEVSYAPPKNKRHTHTHTHTHTQKT
jgi:hypothetical protein